MRDRTEFGRFCDERGYKTCAEVGVDLASFSVVLLGSGVERLYCIDPWEPYPEIPHERETAFGIATYTLARYAGRVTLLRQTSLLASTTFAPESLDLVYVDGAHDRDSVRLDLALWWPKVRRGGVLAGHDYDLPQVREEVDLLSVSTRTKIKVVPANGDRDKKDHIGAWAHPSYYLEKSSGRQS